MKSLQNYTFRENDRQQTNLLTLNLFWNKEKSLSCLIRDLQLFWGSEEYKRYRRTAYQILLLL